MNPPNYWKKTGLLTIKEIDLGTMWEHTLTGLKVIRSLSSFDNNTKWIHVSMSHPDCLPSWDEMRKVKNEFIGEDLPACHVIPRQKDHVNCHPFCLHIWTLYEIGRPVSEETFSLPNLKHLINEQPI